PLYHNSFPTRRSSDLFAKNCSDDMPWGRKKRPSTGCCSVLETTFTRPAQVKAARNPMSHRISSEPSEMAPKGYANTVGMVPVSVDRKSTRLNSSHVSI